MPPHPTLCIVGLQLQLSQISFQYKIADEMEYSIKEFYWPRDIAFLACENADTNFSPLVHNEIGNIRQVMEPWSALFNS